MALILNEECGKHCNIMFSSININVFLLNLNYRCLKCKTLKHNRIPLNYLKINLLTTQIKSVDEYYRYDIFYIGAFIAMLYSHVFMCKQVFNAISLLITLMSSKRRFWVSLTDWSSAWRSEEHHWGWGCLYVLLR